MSGICDYYNSPIGLLAVTSMEDCLTGIDWSEIPGKSSHSYNNKNPVIKKVFRVLDYYFESRPLNATIPVMLEVTSFQDRVLNALLKIPYGQVRTYGELAAALNTSSRAIGQACRTNPISIIIPCHRVVAVNGIGGYSGKKQRTDIKRWLLRHEGIY